MNHELWWYPIHKAITTFIEGSPLIGALITLITIDILTGLASAYVRKKVSSTASLGGMVKKTMILSLVFAGMVMERVYDEIPWGRIISLFFCVTEMVSILENCGKAGLPLPKQITDFLSKLSSSQPSIQPAIENTEENKEESK